MIHHMSLPARDPRRVAKALGEILVGQVVRFVPSGADAYMVYAGAAAAQGVLLEVLPEDARHMPGAAPGDRMAYSYDKESAGATHDRFQVGHVAVSTEVTEKVIEAVAARENWRLHHFWRGRQFPVLELWVENRFMIEVLTQDGARHYAANMTPDKWIEAFGLVNQGGVYELPENPNELARMVLASVRPVA